MIDFTPEILDALNNGADLIVSVSGGKDSDAMSILLERAHDDHGWGGKLRLLHCDLGLMEWTQSQSHCVDMAKRLGAPIAVAQHAKWDLIERIRDRMAKRPDAPPWPSAKARYCTAEFKREVVNKWIRHEYPDHAQVVCAVGLRAEESTARAKKPLCEMRPGATAVTKDRMVLNWNPIHSMKLDEVWATIGYSLVQLADLQEQTRNLFARGYTVNDAWASTRFLAHPAYLLGNERVSCAMCVLASRNDLLNGAQHNPEVFRALVDIEVESGYSFRHKFWLGALCPELLSETQRNWFIKRGII